MQIVYKDLDLIKPYEKNPRNNENAVEYVANSIQEFGFKNPIIIDKNNVIIAGHTRYLASKKLQLDNVPCVIADDLTDIQIKAFRIADNKTSEYASWDNELLTMELSELKDLDFNLELTAFQEWELEELFDLNIDNENTKKTKKDLSDTIKENFELIIACDDESELESLYEELSERGYECRVSTL